MMSKFLIVAAATGLSIGTTALGHAQSSGQRMQDSAPGQRMQDRGSAPGQPGAFGQQMQENGSKPGQPGASAPGRREPSTTGRGGSMGGRDPDRDRGDAR